MLERLGGIYLTRPSGTPVEILVMLEMLFLFFLWTMDPHLVSDNAIDNDALRSLNAPFPMRRPLQSTLPETFQVRFVSDSLCLVEPTGVPANRNVSAVCFSLALFALSTSDRGLP